MDLFLKQGCKKVAHVLLGECLNQPLWRERNTGEIFGRIVEVIDGPHQPDWELDIGESMQLGVRKVELRVGGNGGVETEKIDL